MNTKKLLSDAFYNLVIKKPFHQISIEMILQESGISRATFYRHFKDKYDLMNYYYQSYFESLQYNPQTDNWKMLIKDTLCFMKEHQIFFHNIQKAEGQNSFLDFLQQYCYRFTTEIVCYNTHKSQLTYVEQSAVLFTCAGSVAVVKSWFQNQLKQEVDEVVEVLYQSIPLPIRQALI